MGEQEVANGLTCMASSEVLAERSEELAVAGVVLGVQGIEEVETAAVEAELAKEITATCVAKVATVAAVLGAAVENPCVTFLLGQPRCSTREPASFTSCC